jgi:hypothetical protein
MSALRDEGKPDSNVVMEPGQNMVEVTTGKLLLSCGCGIRVVNGFRPLKAWCSRHPGSWPYVQTL